MSDYARQQAEKDVRDGKLAANMHGATAQEKEKYNAAFQREKEKQNK